MIKHKTQNTKQKQKYRNPIFEQQKNQVRRNHFSSLYISFVVCFCFILFNTTVLPVR